VESQEKFPKGGNVQANKKIFHIVTPFVALTCVLQNANPSLRRKESAVADGYK
jgi:hypothetical protein